MNDPRQTSPAALRNRGPILDLLRSALPSSGLILEVASGTGEHVLHFARALPQLDWQPTDPNADARASIDAHRVEEGLTNIRSSLALDAASAQWPVARADAVLCINMVHISPWASTLGLMRGAAATLPADGLLYLYGPFRRARMATAPSNEAFDQDLKARDSRWGLRDLDAVAAVAADHGLRLETLVDMPANNLSVLFRKGAG